MNKILIALSLLISISFIGCTNKKESGKRILTVTIEPQRYFTEQIAGDKYSVISMTALIVMLVVTLVRTI